jgi:hypothetical protein
VPEISSKSYFLDDIFTDDNSYYFYWTQTGKRTYIRVLCQKNERSVEIKQRPTKMGGRTTYGSLLLKRAPFQIGIDWWSHLRKVPRRRRISHTYPVWLWGRSLFKISSSGPFLYGAKWLLWRSHVQSPTLHLRCGINTGLIKGGGGETKYII